MATFRISPTTDAVADLLIELGWKSSNDAQHANLDDAIQSGRLVTALFSGERHLREYMEDNA